MSSEQSLVGSLPQLDFRRVRSVMETPIMDERKWAKVPGIPADVFLLDLEDTVVPAHKVEARKRVVEHLEDGAFFGERLVMARPNNLATEWGRDDIIAFAKAGIRLMLYPKAQSIDELMEVRALLDEHGAQPLLFPAIETAATLFDVRAISQIPGIGGLFTGIGDLSADAGIPFYEENGDINPVLLRARDEVALAAAAAGIAATDTVYARNLKDVDQVRAAVVDLKRRGYTSLVTFYPPHVDVIHDNLPPSAAEIAGAEEIVARYHEAEMAGKPALVLDDGRTILHLDSLRAQHVLNRAAHTVPTRKDAL